MKIVSFKRQDYCNECNSERGIELYDEFNRPTNYSHYIDNIDKPKSDNFNTRALSYMKCKKCNKEYIINWENKIPEPLVDENKITTFIDHTFKKGGE